MTTHKTKWWLAGLVCLALWPAHASAQGGLWETYKVAGIEAYQTWQRLATPAWPATPPMLTIAP